MLRRNLCRCQQNFLSGSAKLATWLTRRKWAPNSGSVKPVLVLEGLLKAQLTVEYTDIRGQTVYCIGLHHIWAVGGFMLGGSIKDFEI